MTSDSNAHTGVECASRSKLPGSFDEVRSAEAAGTAPPRIGFTGAPFTLASYAIEGLGTRHYAKTKARMFAEPAAQVFDS